MSKSEFQCPFKKIAKSNPSLMPVLDLTASSVEDASLLLQESVRSFLENPQAYAVAAKLPPDIIEGKKPRDVDPRRVIPYAAAAIATEILHIAELPESPERILINQRTDNLKTLLYVEEIQRDFESLYSFVNNGLSKSKKYAYSFPLKSSFFLKDGENMPYAIYGIAGSSYIFEEMFANAGDRNGLLFVLEAPIYPPTIGRYNPDLRMIISKKSDFYSKVSTEKFIKIKAESNLALRDANITNSPGGGWFVPEIEC